MRTGVGGSRVGTLAVPFALDDTGGARHTLADHRGRWLLLVLHRHLG